MCDSATKRPAPKPQCFIVTDEDTGKTQKFEFLTDAESRYKELRKEKPLHTLNLVRYFANYKISKVEHQVIYSTV
jgi:hypothetical protein